MTMMHHTENTVKRQTRFVFDMRTHLLLGFAATVYIITVRQERSFIAGFAAALLFLLCQGYYKKAFYYGLWYGALTVLGAVTIGIQGLQTLWMFTVIGKHLLIPVSFAAVLADRPAGAVLEVLSSMRIPKIAGISAVILFRFFPTIRYELTAIRNSLKFRGVGVHPASILLHPYRNFKLTLIPLLIRTVKISEEMAAAAMVRGVTADNTVISFEKVQWRKRDTAASALGGSLFLALIIAERV